MSDYTGPLPGRAMGVTRVLAATALLMSLAHPALPQGRRADLVVRNAAVYTVDATRSWAQALAVKAGRIVFVGSDRDAAGWIGPATGVVDAQGRLILPGFHDTHVHLALAAGRRQWCDLGYPRSMEATREAMAACVSRATGRQWVLMTNPNTAVFPADGPGVEFLDSVVADRPMVVNALHSSFANSAALRVAGITAATPDPPKGFIARDAAGRPTGALRESAQDLLYKHVPKPSPQELATHFREVLSELPGHGIVSVQELSGRGRAEFYAEALAKGRMTVRMRHGQMLLGGAEAPPLEVGGKLFAETACRHDGRWLNAGTVKVFVDGDLGDHTAALSEPYADADGKGRRGEPIWSQEELNAWATKLDAAGLQLHFHAMGDRAVHMALNAVERAQEVNGRRDSRHQITHLHLIAPADLPRFRKLGVIANIQPYFAENIEYNTVLALKLLGPVRHRWMFRFRDLAESGAVLAISTDGPVASPLNPFVSLQAALTRSEPGSKAPAFYPEQRLTLPEAIAAYTIGGAYANFLDGESGSLEAGKWADFIMLDRNLFETEKEEVRHAKVLWTVIEGREAFRAKDW
jgi:predicted amidohydrolase YtcJ